MERKTHNWEKNIELNENKTKTRGFIKNKSKKILQKKNPTKLQLIKLKALWMMNGDYIEFYI